MLAPACTCEALTHSLARSTRMPRAMPVSVVSSEPSEAPRAARDLTVSKTRDRWCRERKVIFPDCKAFRCTAPSATPGNSVVAASCGVVLRTARLHTATVWFCVPFEGCTRRGARPHACSVVLDASLGLRRIPECSWMRLS